MSDSEQDASVLGKRARNGPGNNIAEDVDMNPPSATQDDDDSDDDVGPMPMPEGAAPAGAGTKKKRKGELLGTSVQMLARRSSAGPFLLQYFRMNGSSWTICRVQTGTTKASCTAT